MNTSKKISKWQKASVDVTNLRFEVSKIFSGFTEEEKQTRQYNELVQTLIFVFTHELESVSKKRTKIPKPWWVKLMVIGIPATIAGVVEIAKYIINITMGSGG